MMNEIDCLMGVDGGGVITYEGDDGSKYARLNEWFLTPEGSVYGMPRWGNPVQSYKHEPTGGEYLAIHLESKILEKLRIDLPEITLLGINCYAANSLPALGGKGGYVVEILTPEFKFTYPG